MGQIVGLKAKPKRCNLNSLGDIPTPAAGEYILVSYDNSMTANGQGNFDRYIMGDGRTAATALELKYLDDSTRPYIVEEVNKAVADIQPIEITGDVTNAPDEEDLTSENQGGTDVLKFKDKAYNSALYSGLGRVYLRKNIVTLEGTGKNVLTQAMVNTANTIYHIQYDYDLNGQTITLPAGCVLEFDGGSLSNGTLAGDYINISAGNTKIFNNITFNAITFNNGLNVCWVGCKGDWTPTASQYTDNTTPFLTALNTGLDLYIPDGKYGFNSPVEYASYASTDSASGRRDISIIGQSVKSTWLVALFSDDTKDFLKITNGFRGVIENVYITTSDTSHCRYGLYTSGLLNGGILRNISIFGNFQWCYMQEGVVQYSSIDINVSRQPENNTTKNPLNGICVNTMTASYRYIYGLHINLFLETYIGGEGLRVATETGTGVSIKALCQGNLSRAGYFNLGTCKALLYDSYCETTYQNGESFVFENSTRVFCRNLFGSAVKSINSYIDAIQCPVDADSQSVVTMDRDYPTRGTGLEAMPNDFSLKIRGGFPLDLHNIYNIGATLESDVSNLASNKYDTIGKNPNAVLCGRGCADKTAYDGFGNSVKIWGDNTDSIPITSMYYADNIIEAGDVNKLRNEKLIGMSVLIKPDNTYHEMTTLQLDLYTETDNVWSFPVTTHTSDWIPLADGWYQVIAIFRTANRIDFTKPLSARFRGLSQVNNAVNNASFYLTQIQVSSANGAIPRHFVVKNGESVNCNIEAGSSENRPNHLTYEDAGLKYVDFGINKEIVAGKAMVEADQTIAVAEKAADGNTPTIIYANSPFVNKKYNLNFTRHSRNVLNVWLSKNNPETTASDLLQIIHNQTTTENYLINISNASEYPYLKIQNRDSGTDVTIKITQEESAKWFEQDGATAGVLRHGATADRPAATDIYVGFEFFDETLGKPIYWNGTAWADATGTAV